MASFEVAAVKECFRGQRSHDAVLPKDVRQNIAGSGPPENEDPEKTVAADKEPDDADLASAGIDEDAEWDFVSQPRRSG